MDKKKKNYNSIKYSFFKMSLVPIIIFSIIVSSANYFFFSNAMYKEVKTGLKGMANVLALSFDVLYEKEIGLSEEELTEYEKEDMILNLDQEFIDRIKQRTQLDISIYLRNQFIFTTIENENGERVVGGTVHSKIVEDVIVQKKEQFYRELGIQGAQYFAYCYPIIQKDGSCIGFICVTKPTKVVMNDILVSIAPNILITIVVLLIVLFICINYAKNMVSVIHKIEKFLYQVSKGNLKTSLDEIVLKREDEIGEMGKFSIQVQKSLREMIEKDNLTKIYNRRYGEERLQQMVNEEMTTDFFCVIGDIDYFKQINETYGYECGDILLKEIAHVIAEYVINIGYVARWSGEEFLFVFEKDEKEALLFLEGLRRKIEDHKVRYKDQIVQVTMTFAVIKGTGKGKREILKKADEKIHYGKEKGRNRIIY